MNLRKKLNLFSLPSHQRAERSIAFALKMRSKGYHVFVMGEDRSGRISSTLEYLEEYAKSLPPPNDWVYLNNFQQQHRPLPFALPAGMGRILQKKTITLINSVKEIIKKTLKNNDYLKKVEKISNAFQLQIDQQIQDIQIIAKSKGWDILQTNDGFSVDTHNHPPETQHNFQKDLADIREELNTIMLNIQLDSYKINQEITLLRNNVIAKNLNNLFSHYKKEFYRYLDKWTDNFQQDILENIELFINSIDQNNNDNNKSLQDRYGINLIVDNYGQQHPKVILESHPTYENLFGAIKYRANNNGALETNFAMIRGGAMHFANGGILVLRADAIAKDPEVWATLKSCLRDCKITIQERYRETGAALIDAPSPHSIPLDIQVFLVSNPLWYYEVFLNDPEFRNYFKVKAYINDELDNTVENNKIYKKFIKSVSKIETMMGIDDDAIDLVLNYSARWVENVEKLSARFELIEELLIEASVMCQTMGQTSISCEVVEDTLNQRRYRNACIEDLYYQSIELGQIIINTSGTEIGQINGLSVISTGEHTYGVPVRITAQTYIGNDGIVNIERLTNMGGPIQQKGALILEGFLKGTFAQDFPLSCSCSLTFEQNYNGVEGDSASLAELAVILSSLAEVAIRQDIAITGAMDQFGTAQAVGGIHHKIEGFHRLCKSRGFTLQQGVIIPETNQINLTLRPDVMCDIAQKKFFIHPVNNIFEAMEILTGQNFAKSLASSSLYKKIYNKLKKAYRIDSNRK